MESLRLDGGCHCGAVRFRGTTRSLIALACNCTICEMVGFLHVIVGEDDFELLQGEAALTTYRFNTGEAAHFFCSRCGVKPFYRPRSHPEGFSINLRCVDDPTVRERFELRPFDGLDWEANVASIQ